MAITAEQNAYTGGRKLAQSDRQLAGLYEGRHKMLTNRPTGIRFLKAFAQA